MGLHTENEMTNENFSSPLAVKLAEALGIAQTQNEPDDANMMLVDVMPWENARFGRLTIGVEGFTLGSVRESDFTSRSKIDWKGEKPTRIKVTFNIDELASDVRVLQLLRGNRKEVTDYERIPSMWVDVIWMGIGADAYPVTRVKGRDNGDIIFIKSTGDFVMVQVSITIRGNKLWLAAQDVYAGAITVGSLSEFDQIGVTTYPIEGTDELASILPLWDHNAFPGADFAKNFKYAYEYLITYGIGNGYWVKYGEISETTQWTPVLPPIPAEGLPKGWVRGTVKWYNIVTGYGFIQCEDGVSCYVEFRGFVDKKGNTLASKGQFPFADPMTGVTLKYKTTDGKRGATAVHKNF